MTKTFEFIYTKEKKIILKFLNVQFIIHLPKANIPTNKKQLL